MWLTLAKKAVSAIATIATPWSRTKGSAPLQISTVVTRAAGGLVTRKSGTEILIIHRISKNDWSLPKGKLKRNETSQQTAIREVREETGYHCKIADTEELNTYLYIDSSNRTKEIRYWLMEIIDNRFNEKTFMPNDEVDVIKWVTKDVALSMLTHERDRELVGEHCYG